MGKTVTLVFPHQLFRDHALLQKDIPVWFIEEALFFRQYKFHRVKLAFHRASMKAYEAHLLQRGFEVRYVEGDAADIRKLIPDLKQLGVENVACLDPTDDWLESRLTKACQQAGLSLDLEANPGFLNNLDELSEYFGANAAYHQADFYIEARKKRNILMDKGGPKGGKWSFDAENRKKYPKKKRPPRVECPAQNSFVKEAKEYVEEHFADHPGDLAEPFPYPVTFEEAANWLEAFLVERFREFGTYEDAIVADESILHHSVLTPMLNVGLLTPKEVLDRAMGYAENHKVPLNSLEGFVRQVMGWREFIRGVYIWKGRQQRTQNFWGFKRQIPPSFWHGETGVVPVDLTIQKTLKYAYNHHIERLMVLGNFMLLCEFDPDEVYRWFMEMYVDAYDWVMVPNVYGMSQFADGGLMATKPYISGSNYLLKMGDFPKGDWQKTWDALFWRFMHVHRNYFENNPRMKMLLATFDKMDAGRRKSLLETADNYLYSVDQVRK
ncbi:cryptochrome/photolyase family protein [Echinicola vietnamensis]|uniref:Deoxyribodipyrimidine photolyase-related protein n=1 Tax=Echinicola vietnamensis (strain DSM 17526 / LMG 23754 / KMM 6221) TaxID=926556 RepID=L0FV39_ECHVK|nr:cryptochrome/photolyase family protein [Echinicola vietnamensis]AGA77769.1 deoxyribodipyrimidine photolyase-related protein [Echinicola vietnamensis DSM 17526]